MKIRAISKLLALLMLMLSFFLALAMGVGVVYDEPVRILSSFIIPIGVNLLFFLAVFFLLRGSEDPYFSPKSGFLFVTLAWVLASAVGALPFVLSGAIPSYTDAYFETMSGFTTTGASILTDIEVLPRSILFWRSLTHWLGGMGIVVLTVAIFPLLGLGGLQLVEAEAPGPSVDKLSPRMAGTAKFLWLTYVALSALEIVLLMIGGMDWFDASTHTFGTMATGGFSPKNASVGHYKSAFIDWVITIFMMLAGLNFTQYYRLVRGDLKTIARDTEFKAYVGLFAIVTTLIAVNLLSSNAVEHLADGFRYAGFQVASILTTTGYATADFDKWPAFSKVLLFFLMFIGGCAGSTGGGIKVIRVVVLFKQAVTEMKYLIFPRGVFGVRVSGQPVRKIMIFDIASLVFLYFTVFFVAMLIVASAGYDILTSVGASIATLGNIGPGFDMVGPTTNYAHFPDYVTWALSFNMLVGRLEVYTVLILFTPAFWRR